MKKLLVTLVIALLVTGSAKAQTQEFAPVGAEWYYTRFYREGYSLTGVTYDRFRSLREVEINGWQCKEIELFRNLDCYGVENPYTELRYITQDGDQVYEVEDGQRYLLYDFGKEVGESWYAPKYNDTIYVTNVSFMALEDGSARRVLETTTANEDWHWYFYNIIEGIGMDYSLFPFLFGLDGAPCVEDSLRCYSVDGVPLIAWGNTECDYEVLSVGEQDGESPVSMNTMVEDRISMAFPASMNGMKRVGVFDMTGRQVLEAETDGENLDIPFAMQPSGVYLVRIKTESQVENIKIVKR